MAAPSETRPSAGYLSGISALNPFSSRTASPNPGRERSESTSADDSKAPTQVKRARDHSVSHRHAIHPRHYPPDCPKLDVQWFHAIDVVKRKPDYIQQPKPDKLPPPPKKWNAFSLKDSRSIEIAFQKLSVEEEERVTRDNLSTDGAGGDLGSRKEPRSDNKPNRSLTGDSQPEIAPVKVPVNEDYLFDVDIRNRELGPAYWLGPIYEVRRGTWFYVDGSNLKPAEENLATQLEEGYLKMAPWRYAPDPQASAVRNRSASGSITIGSSNADDGSVHGVAQAHRRKISEASPAGLTNKPAGAQPLSHRLFGAYMNSIVTYEDSTTAWLMTDDFLSRMSSTMYQRFAGGAHFSGTKLVRGYKEMKKKSTKDAKRPGTPPGESIPSTSGRNDPARRRSAPPSAATAERVAIEDDEENMEKPQESRLRTLERQMSSLVTAQSEDPQKQDEEAQRQAEREIQDDYKDTPGDNQDREIEHLILVTHGIGQRLGARFETFNFIHDVNELRKTLKTVYASSPDLQALNSEVDSLPKNCRVQVLPIIWRHQLDFPQQGVKYNRKEHDIADLNADEDDEYPTLDSITVEGVPALRNIIADLALDILLYQTPAYKDHISRIVVKECNRILKLFKKRNPYFDGKVSLVGHSLGSAIMFDILAEQEKDASAFDKPQRKQHKSHSHDLRLDFPVEDFYCFGSPIGLFQMLKGRTIAARGNPNKVTLDGSVGDLDDPFNDLAYSRLSSQPMTDVQRDAVISAPKCKQLFNIFHPTDPISYRLEPLISPAMSSMKPQPLPYTKKNFFGPMGQGITGIPAKVGQSFSGFWSNFSSGLANSFINRSLGISAEDAARLNAPNPASPAAVAQQVQVAKSNQSRSVGAGTNIIGGGVIAPEHLAANPELAQLEDERKRKLAQEANDPLVGGEHPPTLIDSELETLWGGFQKRRKSAQENDSALRDLGESPEWREAEERERKLRREESKVRALNRNGRVDYSIQEGAFDISFLASIASHLAYWTDEDVCHFVVSQLLSKQRLMRRSKSMSRIRI